jgi:hypothetical protein
MVRGGLFRNEDLADMPIEATVLFVGLLCCADREGRLEYKPRIIGTDVFPLRPDIAVHIPALLLQLHTKGMIRIYTVDSKQYIHVTNFLKHQKIHIREMQSRLPEPPRDDIGQVPASLRHETAHLRHETALQSLPEVEGEEEGEEEVTPTPFRLEPTASSVRQLVKPARQELPKLFEERFDEFWRLYPAHRRGHREVCERLLFQVATEDPRMWETKWERLIAPLRPGGKWAASDDWTKDAGRFVCKAQTYLMDSKWNETPMPAKVEEVWMDHLKTVEFDERFR